MIKNYRILLAVPLLVLILSVAVLVNQYNQTGEWFKRSIELKGGTLITINTEERLEITDVETRLRSKFHPINVREVRSFEGYGTIIDTSSDVEADEILAELAAMGVNTEDSSIESIGPSLGMAFWTQAQIAIITAFIFMGIIVFVIFRTFVPSVAVIMSAMSDILITLGIMQVLGIELSLAGLAALLMLIGYSVDTDIMLTSRLLKESEEKTLADKLKRALKTGLTMTLTSIGALAALLLSAISPVLSQIAMVLLIGLTFDIMNTWLMNSVILRWYCEKRGLI
ncbi:MAG: protein translocase subunit SecF [Candidatus Aenigmatarchaeota archaeon]|nr:MAG: protein translocase subunit SecF [Candidatus Aenigmarchaeota archaeon]